MNTQNQLKKACWLISIPVILAISGNAVAQEKESDRIDIQKLEERYWSAKDVDFSVVQNRTYTKAKRFNLSASYGIPVNDAYSEGDLLSLTSAWYFNERHGLELSYQKANLKDNAATDAFKNDHGTLPNQNRLISSQTLSYAVVPFYAKMSFWDRKVIYFDMGLNVGLGMTQFEQLTNLENRQKSAFHYSIGVTQHLFFSRNFAFRFDYSTRFSSQEKLRYQINATEAESARSRGNSSVKDSSLLFGLTFWL